MGDLTDLSAGVFGFFQNGGRLCYVVNTGPNDGAVLGSPGSHEGVDALDAVDQVAIVCAPGYFDPVSHDRVLTHCENRKDRVAILDGPPRVDDVNELTKVGTTAPPPARRHASTGDDAEGDPTDGDAAATDLPQPTGDADGYKARDSERGFGAQYVPHIITANPLDGTPIVAPPSGHIAGIWARTDAERGVHKAPANRSIRGATGFSQYISHSEQELAQPRRRQRHPQLPRRGILVWGARTRCRASPANGAIST